MDKAEELRQWFRIGDNELESADHLDKTQYPPPDEVICYLCQQAAEKHLKGYLRLHDIDPPRIHDLAALRKSCERLHPEFARLAAQTQVLTQYSALARYPGPLQITREEARTALQYAKDIKAFVDKARGFVNTY